MKRVRGVYTSVILSVVGSLLITACSVSRETKPIGTNEPLLTGNITVVTNRTDLIDSKYMEYTKQFQQMYPGVKVQFEALRDYDRNIKIRLASGETPDGIP